MRQIHHSKAIAFTCLRKFQNTTNQMFPRLSHSSTFTKRSIGSDQAENVARHPLAMDRDPGSTDTPGRPSHRRGGGGVTASPLMKIPSDTALMKTNTGGGVLMAILAQGGPRRGEQRRWDTDHPAGGGGGGQVPPPGPAGR